jgi:hypothetical protein
LELLVGIAVEANRLLKFAKENSDVGLCFSPLGPLDQDKLRHAKVKFLYDPGYVAAKKKTLEEKREELESSTKTGKQKLSKNVKKPKYDFQPEKAKTPENDLTLEDEAVPADEHMTAELFCDEEFKMNAEHDIAQNDLATSNAKMAVNVFYAESSEVVKYVNARRASHVAAVTVCAHAP